MKTFVAVGGGTFVALAVTLTVIGLLGQVPELAVLLVGLVAGLFAATKFVDGVCEAYEEELE